MDRLELGESESRFASFVDSLGEAIGHWDRRGPLRDYCAGLLAGSGRKSVEPLAAITAPGRVSAQHQSLLHFVGKAPWSDEAVLGKVRELTLPALEKQGPVEAWIIDDTGFPKKGKHSVGVARWRDRPGTELRRGHSAANLGVAAGRRPLATQSLRRKGAAGKAGAPR